MRIEIKSFEQNGQTKYVLEHEDCFYENDDADLSANWLEDMASARTWDSEAAAKDAMGQLQINEEMRFICYWNDFKTAEDLKASIRQSKDRESWMHSLPSQRNRSLWKHEAESLWDFFAKDQSITDYMRFRQWRSPS